MSPEIARTAIEFLNRVQLNVQEIPAINQVMDALRELSQPKLIDEVEEKSDID